MAHDDPRPGGATERLRGIVPPAVRGGVLDPGRRAVGALAVLGVVSALFAAGYLWRSRPEPVPVPPRQSIALSSPSQPGSPASSASPADVVVDVGGKVTDPGVYTLPGGARVMDALDAAGGVKQGADTTAINLARPVVDGEKILVGVPRPPGLLGAGPGASTASGELAKINVNTASGEQLQELPGVGEVLAQRIIEYRAEHGPFEDIAELNEISGIGEKTLADLEDEVQV